MLLIRVVYNIRHVTRCCRLRFTAPLLLPCYATFFATLLILPRYAFLRYFFFMRYFRYAAAFSLTLPFIFAAAISSHIHMILCRRYAFAMAVTRY